MKKLMVVFLLGLASCSSSTADDAPIKVAVEYRTTQNQQTGEYFQYPNVRIRAVADQVEIIDLIGNDGDCNPLPYVNPKLPKILKKGQAIEYAFQRRFCQRLSTFEVETLDDTYTFHFE